MEEDPGIRNVVFNLAKEVMAISNSIPIGNRHTNYSFSKVIRIGIIYYSRLQEQIGCMGLRINDIQTLEEYLYSTQ
jgi:hypothetical protein